MFKLQEQFVFRMRQDGLSVEEQWHPQKAQLTANSQHPAHHRLRVIPYFSPRHFLLQLDLP